MGVDNRNEKQQRQVAAALNRLRRLKIQNCIDPEKEDSKPSEKQQEVLDGINLYRHRYLRCGNQIGKSTIGAREVSWLFEENHPTWKRPAEWGDESLLILVVGRVGQQVEESLWRKIKGFLEVGTYEEKRSSQTLQKVVNTKNGNTILFMSHHSTREAQEKLQSYVAHYAWVDEMPGSFGIFEEIHRRIEARKGYFLATFTPKVKNEGVRRFVDAQEKVPYAHVYRLHKFDNPIYAARKDEVLASMSGLPEKYVNAVLWGDWLDDDNTVYHFDSESMVCSGMPPNYHPGWRHVEAVDPALKSKFGYVLLAEDPATGHWYVVRASYIQGIFVPTEMVTHMIKQTAGYNICRRVSDPHEVWYIETANHMRVKPAYMGVHDKSNRKSTLMKNLQEALGTRLFICDWNTDLINEFQTMRWSEESEKDKIVNSSSFHLIDALQYGLDVVPSHYNVVTGIHPDVLDRERHFERLEKRAKEQAKPAPIHRKPFKIQRRNRWA